MSGIPRCSHTLRGTVRRNTQNGAPETLRGAHMAMTFMEEVAGVASGRETHRLAGPLASRMLTVCYPKKRRYRYHRIFVWWIHVQSWRTVRFDDHRCIKPAAISCAEGSVEVKDYWFGSRRHFTYGVRALLPLNVEKRVACGRLGIPATPADYAGDSCFLRHRRRMPHPSGLHIRLEHLCLMSRWHLESRRRKATSWAAVQ